MKLAIYGHGGSENHGNEAIVRGIRTLFPNADITLYTHHSNADRHYELDSICKIKQMVGGVPKWVYILYKVFNRLKVFNNLFYKYWYKPFLDELDKDTVYILEAGDQYCEKGGNRRWYAYLNKEINKIGAKTVMMGCTINPEILEKSDVLEDIRNYSAVIARESITYNALLSAGINAKFAPCPAFTMQTERFEVPTWVEREKFIGFNIGFLQQGNEKYYDILFKNYENAINYLVNYTDYRIALIPHVNWNYLASDFIALDALYKRFKDTGKVYYVNEHSASKQKYIISKCKAFVSVRTHAAISGLAACVPTIIAGYKIKSMGLARDIYGEEYDMLAQVQSLETEWVIKEKLEEILPVLPNIKEYQKTIIPEYIKGTDTIVDVINHLREQ